MLISSAVKKLQHFSSYEAPINNISNKTFKSRRDISLEASKKC